MASPHVTVHVVGFAQVTVGITVRVVRDARVVLHAQAVLDAEAATMDAIVGARVALGVRGVAEVVLDVPEIVPAVPDFV